LEQDSGISANPRGQRRHGGKHRGFRKKATSIRNLSLSLQETIFKGVAFCVGPNGPELYLKMKEPLGMYVSSEYTIQEWI